MSDATIHGIANCDTVRKARAWLAAHRVAARFHDYRKDGVPEASLRAWVAAQGWPALLNRSGTTFRNLPDGERQELDDEMAVALMLRHPAAIRRPVLVAGDAVLVGFSPAAWKAALDGWITR